MTGKKENVILVGPFVGEMFWEFFRFAPYIINQISLRSDVKVIVYTRPDRFDIYGDWVNEFEPLIIEGDGVTKFAECFRLMNMSLEEYNKLAKDFVWKYSKKYNIIKHLYPDISSKSKYLNKDYYPISERTFNYCPRYENTELIKKFLKDVTKKIIIIAPRYRANFKRNWSYWNELYDIIYNDSYLMDNFEFIICGKKNEYIPDKKNRFKDLNDIKLTKRSSLIGLLMTLMDEASMTVGSQSAIPNISLLFEVPVVEWGNQPHLHTITYNIFKTKVIFIEDPDFNTSAENVHKKMIKLIRRKIL